VSLWRRSTVKKTKFVAVHTGHCGGGHGGVDNVLTGPEVVLVASLLVLLLILP
jgi:hypothetical protein